MYQSKKPSKVDGSFQNSALNSCLLRLSSGNGSGLGLGGFLLLGRGNDGVQDGAFHSGHELDDAGFADVLDQAVDDGVAEFAVGHLAAAEAEAGLDLVALGEEAHGLVLLGLIVVLIHGDGELDLFDRDDFLLFAGGAFALFLLVEEAPVILDTADGWDGVGRNLDKVQTTLAGNSQRLEGRKDAELFAVFVDDADFARANSIVDANKGLCGTFVECDDAPPRFRRRPASGLFGTAAGNGRTLSITSGRAY